MSSDKNSSTLPSSKPGVDPQNLNTGYINPGNIDYSIIKNYYPNQNYPTQSFMNYPVDMNFQQNQSYQPSNYSRLHNLDPPSDLRNIYYTNFTSQTNNSLTVNPTKIDNVAPQKQSNFSNFPPPNSFSSQEFSDVRNQTINYQKDQYNNDKKTEYKLKNDSDNRNYNNRNNSNNLNSSSNYQRHNNYNEKVASNFSRNRNEPNKEEIRMDWICPVETCRNRNFAKRDKCNLCKTPKPENPEYDNSEFPKRRKKEESRSKSRSRSRRREVKDKEKERDRDRDRERENDRNRERDRDRDRVQKDRERRSGEEKRHFNSNYNTRRYEKRSDNERDSRERKDSKYDRKGTDWECGKCRSINYPHRYDCYKCGNKKHNTNFRDNKPEENSRRDYKDKYNTLVEQGSSIQKTSNDQQTNNINPKDLGEFSKILSQISNTKGFGNDFNQSGMSSQSNNSNTNMLLQMFQLLQAQGGGNMTTLLQTITNNNTAFQTNRMSNSYNNIDTTKGNQESYKLEKKY